MREATHERATNVGPVKKKEKKRIKEKEKEREGGIKREKFLHQCKDFVLVHADGLGKV